MKTYKYTINGNKYDVAINEAGETTAIVTVNGEEFKVEWEKPVEEKPVVKVQPTVAKPAAPVAAPTTAPTTAVNGHAIKTPLPGVIIDVKVNVGDAVKKGDTVVVLEAMKM
ncbi:MAG: acetyl-CoA carboxylase biotin carboxyl carrier protein subunit, partial [Bacteroidaceae bacterium]|nr:acetyl-CoA carboxylase biotin carboxyl carrier protein subunit [Bacteroidaceae bacterium]